MREISKIIIHCSATKPSMDIGADIIRQWHTRERGWDDIGYHYVITRDGEKEFGRAENTPGAHARGHNKTSIGICMVGGMSEDGGTECNFTFDQYNGLDLLLDEMKLKYPNAEILGHRDLPGVTKQCPCFDVKSLIN